MSNRAVVYFSLHLDDAIFSCAGTICKQTEAGISVRIVTLFWRGASSSQRSEQSDTKSSVPYQTPHTQRISKDVKAVEACGASYLHLGLLDAPFRNASYTKLHNLFGEIHPNDAATVTILRQAIETVLKESHADSAYFPLAIGGHIEHRLTFLAAKDLQFDGRKYFYEDRLYVFAPRSRHRRLRLIGVACQDGKRERFIIGETYNLLRDLNLSGEFSLSLSSLIGLVRRYLFSSENNEKPSSIAL